MILSNSTMMSLSFATSRWSSCSGFAVWRSSPWLWCLQVPWRANEERGAPTCMDGSCVKSVPYIPELGYVPSHHSTISYKTMSFTNWLGVGRSSEFRKAKFRIPPGPDRGHRTQEDHKEGEKNTRSVLFGSKFAALIITTSIWNS